jgi:hypothetical protein
MICVFNNMFGIAAGLSHFTFQDHPTVRQALLYDATIRLVINICSWSWSYTLG